MGINLFPDKKSCPFDCPYCEVFPFATNAVFSLEQMERDLRNAISCALEQKTPVKDICFSGNGEPSLCAVLPQALELTGKIRTEMAGSAQIVLITNGAGLLQPQIFSLLKTAATTPLALNIWLKLDAGTQDWYEKINRTAVPFEKLIVKIKEFVSCAPVTIQTMLCAVDGNSPPPQEEKAWEQLIVDIASNVTKTPQAASGIRKVQLYGKARPSPEDPKTSPLPPLYLEERATSLRKALADAVSAPPPVEVYI